MFRHFHILKRIFGRCGIAAGLAIGLAAPQANACCCNKTTAVAATTTVASARMTVLAVPAVRMVAMPVMLLQTACNCQPTVAPTLVPQPTLAPVQPPVKAPLNVPPPPEPAGVFVPPTQNDVAETTTTTTTTTTRRTAALGATEATASIAAQPLEVVGVARKLTLFEKLAALRQERATLRAARVVEQQQAVATVETTTLAAVSVRPRRLGCRL
jgi:hypothetical protein